MSNFTAKVEKYHKNTSKVMYRQVKQHNFDN